VTGDGRGSEAEGARAESVLRPRWADSAVEAAVVRRQGGGSGHYGWEWENALDYMKS
jgi:hypothetical protein